MCMLTRRGGEGRRGVKGRGEGEERVEDVLLLLLDYCMFIYAVNHHVKMKVIVAREIETLLHRPNISAKAQ